MALTPQQVLAALDRSRAVLEAAVRETSGTPAQRAARLVVELHALWPASLYACLLQYDGHEAWSVGGKNGATPTEEERLRAELHRWYETDGDRPSVARLDLPAEATFPSHGLVCAALNWRGHRYGALAGDLPADQQEAATIFLALAAERVAALLSQEESERLTPDERERQAWLDNVSELTSIVSHEFNNLLNGIMLHVAVLKQEVPKEIWSELDVIRGLGNNAAILVKHLQKYNSKRRGNLQPLDLNQVIRDAVSERRAREPALSLCVELDPDLPSALGKPYELGRLLNLLIDQARAAMGAHPGPISIRTLRGGNRPQLRVEDSGPPIDETLLPRTFEPFTVIRPGGDEVGLAVCHTLARHLHGSMRAENRPEKGVAFTVEFSPAVK